MMPQTRRPHQLRKLSIAEVSVVDSPACATVDPSTGVRTDHATIAIWKRDESVDGSARPRAPLDRAALERRMDQIEVEKVFGRKDDAGTQSVAVPEGKFNRTPPVQGDKRKGKKMKTKVTPTAVAKSIFSMVNKTPSGVTRQLIEAEARAGAELIAKRKGITIEEAESRVWAKGGDPLLEAYNLAKAGAPRKPDRGVMRVTRSEAVLDGLARRIMKSTGADYVQAMGAALQQRPDLYAAYDREKAAGEVFEVPDQPEDRGFVGTQAGQKRKATSADGRWQDAAADLDDDDGDEDGSSCPKCKSKTKSGSKYCAACGEKLKADGADSLDSMYARR